VSIDKSRSEREGPPKKEREREREREREEGRERTLDGAICSFSDSVLRCVRIREPGAFLRRELIAVKSLAKSLTLG